MIKQKIINICAVFLAGVMALFAFPLSAQAQSKEAYVVKSSDETTLTFYYDTQRASRAGTVWGIEQEKEDENYNTYHAWTGTWDEPEAKVLKAVFDASFKDFRPTATDRWFLYFPNLKEIKGLENLNTSEVTEMNAMFSYCGSLSSLDLSSFNTSAVTTMSSMFASCGKLTTLNISNFDTKNVKEMSDMFNSCSALTDLNLSSFNTSAVTDMSAMFYGCEKLSKLDLSHFDTKKVKAMMYMFTNCAALQTLYCNDDWTCEISDEMFLGCTNLKGAVAYDEDKVDVSMANPTTGYFSKKEISGILTTHHDAENIKAIYSPEGKRLNELQRGLNIVRMTNGTTQKILRK